MVNSFKIFPNLVYEAIMYGDYLIIEDLLALIFISAGKNIKNELDKHLEI